MDSGNNAENDHARAHSVLATYCALSLGIAALLGYASYRNFAAAQQSQKQVERSLSVLHHSDLLLSSLKDAESGQRGYLLTGRLTYLQPYVLALPRIEQHLSALQTLNQETAEQRKLTSQLHDIAEKKLAELAETIAFRESARTDLALALVLSDRGQQQMEQARLLVADLQHRQSEVISRGREASGRELWWLRASLLGSFIAIIALLGLGSTTLYQQWSKRQKAEAALSMSDAGFRTMAETVPSMLLSGEPDGTQTYLSPRWVQYTGMSLDQSYGVGWMNAIHPVERSDAQAGWSNAVGAKTPFDMTFRLRRNDGVYHWVLAKAAPVIDAAGEVRQWCGSLTDVHEYKQLEERLISSNHELEHFAYAASHDLQEPLRGITLWTQLLRRHRVSVDPEEAELFTGIVDSAKRMAEMLKGLLEYARLESENSTAPFENISMDLALHQALHNLSLSISETHAQVTFDLLPEISWSGIPAVQILQNLIGNAIKYRRPEVDPQVHVSCSKSPGEMIFAVRDNGLGMRSDDIDKAFWIFKRLHQNPASEGTGLGLAFCKRLVERRGGHLWAESVQGEGSTFFFAVPYRQEENQSSSPSGLLIAAEISGE